MLLYETILIIKPQLSDEQVAEVLEKAKKIIADTEGEFVSEDLWGRRKFAYMIDHTREGFYVCLKFKAVPKTLIALDHHMRISEDLIRATTLRVSTKKPIIKKPRKPPSEAKAAA